MRYVVSFVVETTRSLGPGGEAELEHIVEQMLDGMRDSGLPAKYDATNVSVRKEDE